MYREGLEASLKSAALTGASPERIAERLRLFETKGMDGYRRQNLDDLLERNRKGQYVSAVAVAGLYNALKDKKNALDWLEKAYDERTFQILFLKTFPGWAPLHSEPRYRALLRNMRLL